MHATINDPTTLQDLLRTRVLTIRGCLVHVRLQDIWEELDKGPASHNVERKSDGRLDILVGSTCEVPIL